MKHVKSKSITGGVARSYRGGDDWIVMHDGRISLTIEHASEELERNITRDSEGFARTAGQPKTARKLLEQYGQHIKEAADVHGVAAHTIAAIILCESRPVRGTFERDVVSERHESGFVSWSQTPERGSAGLGQQLLATARRLAKKHNLEFFDAFDRPRDVMVSDLIEPSWSIWFTAAYIADKEELYQTDDPIIAAAAYNRGSLEYRNSNPFRVKVHAGADRVVKHAAYNNDYLAAMRGR